MDTLNHALKTIKPDQSIEADSYRSYRRGEISQDQWAVSVAVLEGSRCQMVLPRSFIPLTDFLRNYCEKRQSGSMPYDPVVAHRLGEWFYGIQSAWDWNLERLEYYTWAAERTRTIGAATAHENLIRARDRFASFSSPQQDINLVLHVKKLDSYSRTKESK